jgi:hypothetical protein
MTFWFKFLIPTNSDGSVVSYSPGWCGTRPQCAQNEKGLYYNDKDRWGIGIADGAFVPPDVEVIDAQKALDLMGVKTVVAKTALIEMDSEGKLMADKVEITLPEPEEGVFFGKKLTERYLPEAETIDPEPKPVDPMAEPAPALPKEVASIEPRYCPTCHQIICVLTRYLDGSVKVTQDGKTVVDGLTAKNLVLTCQNGHKVRCVLDA